MEATAIFKTCSRCGRTGIDADACPDCGAPTYTPAGSRPTTAAASSADAVGAPMLAALAGAALSIGSLFATWYHMRIPDELRGLLGSFAGRFGQSFDQIAPGTSAQVNQSVDELVRNGVDISGWQAFKMLDIAIAIAAGLAAVLIVTLLVYGRAVAKSVPDVKRLVGMLGAFVRGAAVYRMINQPDPGAWFNVGIGAWLAVAGGAAMVLGAAVTVSTKQTYE